MNDVSESPRRLDLVLAGGPNQGLGHVMRCAALARAARASGLSVQAWLDAPPEIRAIWSEVSDDTPVADWSLWSREGRTRAVLLDFPGDKSNWIGRARASGAATIVLDDMRFRDLASMSIGPQFHDRPLQSRRVASGPAFHVLSNEHRGMDRAAPRRSGSLLLSLGGADPHCATLALAPRIARVIDTAAGRHRFPQRDVVLGAAFRRAEPARLELERGGWRVHHALDGKSMARLMSQSALCVAGFGTSLGELAWHGTPSLALVHRKADVAPARRMQALGFGRYLGRADCPDLITIESGIRRAVCDIEDGVARALRAQRALAGGRGAERIIARIRSLLDAPSDVQTGEAPLRESARSAARSMSAPSSP